MRTQHPRVTTQWPRIHLPPNSALDGCLLPLCNSKGNGTFLLLSVPMYLDPTGGGDGWGEALALY